MCGCFIASCVRHGKKSVNKHEKYFSVFLVTFGRYVRKQRFRFSLIHCLGLPIRQCRCRLDLATIFSLFFLADSKMLQTLPVTFVRIVAPLVFSCTDHAHTVLKCLWSQLAILLMPLLV